jgi:protein O-GlcNAc transferase
LPSATRNRREGPTPLSPGTPGERGIAPRAGHSPPPQPTPPGVPEGEGAGSAGEHVELGKRDQVEGRRPDALAHFDAALRLQLNHAAAHFHRGETLHDLGRFDEALASYRQALRSQPDSLDAFHNVGHALVDLGRGGEASQWWLAALRNAPTDGARIRLLLAMPSIFQSIEHLRAHRARLNEGLSFLENAPLKIADPLLEVNATNFYTAYHGFNERDVQARLTAILLRAAPSLAFTAPHCQNRSAANRPLRVGFLSSFLHMHTIGEVNLGLIRNLSRQACRVILLQPPGPDDPIAKLIRESADEVVTLTPSLAAARAKIAAQRLDVLFYPDIGMEPFSYFLAFARLAPVQCTTWGHPMTTGIPNLDYYLSSELLEPAGAEAHYTERLVRLRNLPTFYYAPAFFPPAKTRRDFDLNDDDHLYMCSQAPFKVHPDFDAWLGDILRADPRGHILMIRGHEPNWTHQLLRRFQRSLPDVAPRIRFLPHQGGQAYLHLLNVCDVLLDTTHFGGGNTAFKAFSVGAPIVTTPCAFARGNVTTACYRKMGVVDCVAADRADYVRVAVRLANDRPWRDAVCGRIQAARRVLFENAEILRELEQFFVEAVVQSNAIERSVIV